MVRFSYHASQVLCEELNSGALNIAFYGPLTHKGFDALHARVCGFADTAPAVVMRFDTALLAQGGDFMCCDDCQHEAMALVVPEARYEQAMQLARKAAAMIGVRRPVFLPEQSALAYQWAAHVARSQSGKLPLPLR